MGTTWFDTIIAAHTAVTNSVSHSERLKSNRYFVWQENGKADFEADNQHVEGAVTGSTDFFTKTEFDPWVDDFERSMNEFGIIWKRESTQYEEDTGFYHIEWSWAVI